MFAWAAELFHHHDLALCLSFPPIHLFCGANAKQKFSSRKLAFQFHSHSLCVCARTHFLYLSLSIAHSDCNQRMPQETNANKSKEFLRKKIYIIFYKYMVISTEPKAWK